MNSLNSVLIEGNLVRDADVRSTPKGTTVCTFQIVCNRYYRQDSNMEKEVSFFTVQTWSKVAQNAANFGKKGRGVRVVGRLKQERWQDSGGNAKSNIIIVAEHIEFRPDFNKEPSTPTQEPAEAENYASAL
jgi:single-strand DNA-binding protein